MHDSRPHPLLSQIPLIVSPTANLPQVPTLPYTYRPMPTTLPPSLLDPAPTSSPSARPPPPLPDRNQSPSVAPSDQQQQQQVQQQQGQQQAPKYVVSSATGTRAHPREISAQCAALLAHLDRLRDEAARDLAAFEQRQRDRDLAEKRRVAPGWLDSEDRLLEPDNRKTAAKETSGAGFDVVAGLGVGASSSSWNARKEGREHEDEEEERELRNAVAGMSLDGRETVKGQCQGQGQGGKGKEKDLGDEIDRAFGGI